jgi:membrane carboxypeptidase/penicillin-binding protein
LPIWTAFMRGASAGRPARDFEAPSGVTMVTIDPQSGLRATPGCPATTVEVFLDEDAPLEACPLHGGAPTFEAAPPPGARERGEEKKSWWRRWF